MFIKLTTWLEERNPNGYGIEKLKGIQPESGGKPTEFWQASSDFIDKLVEVYNLVQDRTRQIRDTLDLVETSAQEAAKLYQKADSRTRDRFNKISDNFNLGG
nr:hypothetical protein [Kibdelosporangium sp. MJ126-NF4]